MSDNGWIGMDLDGTLAEYDYWRGIEHIGPPIAPMVTHLKKYLANGYDVRIFTARAGDPTAIPFIKSWCKEHIGQVLPVTNMKDYGLIRLYDDRAVAVERNTGQVYSFENYSIYK